MRPPLDGCRMQYVLAIGNAGFSLPPNRLCTWSEIVEGPRQALLRTSNRRRRRRDMHQGFSQAAGVTQSPAVDLQLLRHTL